MHRSLASRCFFLTGLAILLLRPAFAGPITVDAGWYGFCFDEAGSAIYAGCQNEGIGTVGNPVTFTLSGWGLFKITDAFRPGDSFDVDINGDSVIDFATPSVPAGPFITGNPDVAFANPNFSSGQILLPPGSYSILVFVRDSPFGSGGGYFEVETTSGPTTVIPEPATLTLLIPALALLFYMRKRDCKVRPC